MMTNQQLYLAIGLPCLAIVVSLINSVMQFWSIKEWIKEIREDIRSVNTKLDLMMGKLFEHDTELTRLKDKTGLK